MARIALTVAGAVAGAALGIFTGGAGLALTGTLMAGLTGASAGASVGRLVGAIADPYHEYGPRLADLAVSSSANGVVIPFGYGTYRVPGNIVWCPGLVENQQNQSAKGGVTTTYNYYAPFAASFGQGPGEIVRIWGDSKVIYETGGPAYFPSKYFTAGSAGYWGGVCGAFVDNYGSVIEAVWFGHGWTYTVPSGATALQLGINGNYQALASGGFSMKCSVAGGQTTTVYVPATALPWEVVGSENASYPFGNVGGTAPVLALQNLTTGQSITVAAIPNGQGGYEGRITMNASVGTNALGNSTNQTVQWYGPDGDTSVATGNTQTAPPASIYTPPTCYSGTEDQEPDPDIQASEGMNSTPAFKGLIYAVFGDLPLANFGNRIPNIRAEVAFQSSTYPSFPSIVQAETGGSSGSTAVVTLIGNPSPGNTLLFFALCGQQGTLGLPAGVTSLAEGSPGAVYYDGGCAVGSRVVQAGDGKSWTFSKPDTSGSGAPNTFAVVELVGQPNISAAAGVAGNTGSTVQTNVMGSTGPALAIVSFIDYFYSSNTFVGPSAYSKASWASGDRPFYVASGDSIPEAPVEVNWGVISGYTCPVVYVSALCSYGNIGSDSVQVGVSGLDAVVQDICLRAGLQTSQIDVTRLAGQSIVGYSIGRLSSAQQILQPLAMAYFFDAAEIDGVLRFIPRGQSSVMTIPESDLGMVGDHAEYTESIGQEQDLPREIQVTYADQALDYQPNKQAKRRSVKVVKTRQQSIIELPFAIETDTAMQICEKALYLAYLERRSFNINLWKALYSILTPTDVIQFVGRGVTQQVRITKTSEGAGHTVALTSVSEASSVYLSQASGGLNTSYQGGSQAMLATVTMILFDVPLLRDSDANPAGTGYYFGLMASSGFAGGILDTATDNSNFNQESQASAGMTYGTALSTLGAPASFGAINLVNSLHVQLVSGSLSSVTQSQLIQQGANALLVGSEVIQFETATQNTDGSWTVSNLLRGRRGTDSFMGSHSANETVVVLGSTGLVRVSQPNSILSVSRYYRFIPYGQTLDAVSSQDFTVTGNDLKPWSPVAIGGSQDSSGNWTISWLRRTRFGGSYGTGNETLIDGIGGPVNEQSEEYSIDILGGSPLTVKRTLIVNSPTAIYPSALQIADFGAAQSSLTVNIYQVSAVVGRGFKATATLPATTDAPVVLPSGGASGQFYIN